MMTKDELRAELGDYIYRFHKRRDYMGLEDALYELGQDLEDLFDGKDAPTAFIYVVEQLPDCRFLLKVDSLGPTTDKEEWLACFQDYVGDRFVVEPYEVEPRYEHSFTVNLEDLVDPPPPKAMYLNIFGGSYPVEMLKEENLAMMTIRGSLPVARPSLSDRHISTLKSYGVPGPATAGDNNVD